MIADVEMIFKFIGGLGMFLYGMNAMADGLQKSAGRRMQQLLGVLTSNRLLGILVGAGVTAIVQSSSATTVMVVGFVNAGIINLTQAVGIIMGANIGTTVTSWLVSMNEWGELLKPEFFAPLVVGLGAAFVLFSKNHRKREVGEILVGFGVLFIGLAFMSSSIQPYRDAPIFSQAFAVLGRNPLLGILTGALVTAVIQSSSASVGILQTLALNGVVNWQSAIFITLGQNIGTCVTALLSSVGAHKTAKRAAIIHLLFNVMGAAIFGIIMFVLFLRVPGLAVSSINSVEISIFHTVFNVCNTVLLFPFAGLLVKLSCMIVRDEKRQSPESNAEQEVERHLDDRILESPSFAIENVNHEVGAMGRAVLSYYRRASEALLDSGKEPPGDREAIDRLESALTGYLVKINNLSLSDEQHMAVKNLFYTINDIKRIGAHTENLVELAQQRTAGDVHFSPEVGTELKEIIDAAADAVEHAVNARENGDVTEVRSVIRCEEKVDNLEEELRDRHIGRLSENRCSTEAGVLFLDAIGNLERIADHAHNIAGYVMDEI